MTILEAPTRLEIGEHTVFATPSGEHVSVRTLLGRDAPDLQQVHVMQGARAAAAISRGGAPKSYGTATSNEDAVLFAEGPCGLLLAIADAHAGPQASEWVLHWLTITSRQWMTHGASTETWLMEAMDLFFAANGYLVQQNIEHSTHSRTTLAIVFLDVIHGVVLAASAGDSHVYVVGTSQASAVAKGAGAGEFFLGQAPASRLEVAEACAADVIRVSGERAVVLATDGLSTNGIGFPNTPAVVHEIITNTHLADHPQKWSAAVAGALATRGCEVQAVNNSGDDIAVAVAGLWKTVEDREGTSAWNRR